MTNTGRNFTGRAGCIRLGQRGDLRGGFVNNVESYRWIRPPRATPSRPPWTSGEAGARRRARGAVAGRTLHRR